MRNRSPVLTDAVSPGPVHECETRDVEASVGCDWEWLADECAYTQTAAQNSGYEQLNRVMRLFCLFASSLLPRPFLPLVPHLASITCLYGVCAYVYVFGLAASITRVENTHTQAQAGRRTVRM